MARTTTVVIRWAPVLLLTPLAVLPAATARGEQIGWWFEAEDVDDGFAISGRFGFDPQTPPSFTYPSTNGGSSEITPWHDHPAGFEVVFQGYTWGFALPMGVGINGGIILLGDSDPGTGPDRIYFQYPFVGASTDGPSFSVRLVDDDGTAFDSYLHPPATLDLSLFESAEIWFRPFPHAGPYVSQAVITSLTPGAPPVLATSFPAPEPGSAVLVACGLMGVGLGVVRRQRGSARRAGRGGGSGCRRR